MKNQSQIREKNAKYILEELEPRQLFSGGIEGLVVSQVDSPAATYLVVNDSSEQPSAQLAEVTTSSDTEQQTHEIVFVDTGVENYQSLVDDLTNNSDTSRNIEVVLLDSDSNGIDQITEALKGQTNLDAIHIISHGSDGNVQLGNTSLNADTLIENKLNIALWANAFSESGDILLYGCSLADTEVGESLIKDLSALTLADVAASDDLTGNESLGGDWELERVTGSVEATVVFSTQLQNSWEGVLPNKDIIDWETLDSDADGRIDQIRMTADGTALNDDFSDINVTVTGYALDPTTPYSTDIAGDEFFYVNLVEGSSFDTDATPTVTVTANANLKVDGNKINTGAGVATDTAAPVLVSASGNIATGGQLLDTEGEYLNLVFSEGLNAAPSEAQLEAALNFAGGATDADANLPDIGSGADPITLITTNVANDTVRVTFDTNNTASINPLLVDTHTVDVGLGTNLTDADGNTANTAAAAVTISGYANAGGPYTINEGDSINLDASASNPDSLPLTYSWDIDNDTFFGDVTGESPSLTWAQLQSFGIDDDGVYTISVEVSGGLGGPDTASTTINVGETAPTLVTTGSATSAAGALFTLNLNANDPGNDTITSWTINWGDGAIETFAGNPSSVTHTYTNVGFTYNILASAVDEDGTYLQNKLVVGSSQNDSVILYDATGGSPLVLETGLDYALDPIIGPDGDIYVSGWNSGQVLRYDGTTGAFIEEFVASGSGGLAKASGLAFGPDSHLYVSSHSTSEVLRYDGTTGAFIDAFVTAGSGGLNKTEGLTFGSDGNLYVSDFGNDAVYRYDGTSGAFIDEFVAAGSGGLKAAEDLTFGPDGNLYVVSEGTNSVLRYNGTTGAFIDEFVTSGDGGLKEGLGLQFGPDGSLYVGSSATDNVLRYDGTTGAFIDEYITAGSGTLSLTTYLNFLPGHQVTITPVADVTAPTILSRETADLDGDGFIDAIHVTFSEAIDDATVAETDWAVAGGVTLATFNPTENGDTANNLFLKKK
jgi:outer membrane protein assembly factor BamB